MSINDFTFFMILGGDISESTQSGGMLSNEPKSNKNTKSKEKIEQQENRRQAVEGKTLLCRIFQNFFNICFYY